MKDQRILDVTLVVVVIYNLIFLADVIMLGHGTLAAGIADLMDRAQDNKGIFTWIEGMAVAALFIDFIVRFDDYENRHRKLRTFAVALACTGFVFKAFAFYLDSSFLE